LEEIIDSGFEMLYSYFMASIMGRFFPPGHRRCPLGCQAKANRWANEFGMNKVVEAPLGLSTIVPNALQLPFHAKFGGLL
jgi:hypothetical protein